MKTITSLLIQNPREYQQIYYRGKKNMSNRRLIKKMKTKKNDRYFLADNKKQQHYREILRFAISFSFFFILER